MLSQMSSRERMLTSMRHQIPDRVPVAPDISNMVPCRLTGKPFWEIYVNQSPPLWQTYLDAVKYYEMDGWVVAHSVKLKQETDVTVTEKVCKQSNSWEVVRTYHTPDGELHETVRMPKADSPVPTEKLIKNFKEDFKKIRHLYSKVIGYDDSLLQELKKAVGEDGVVSSYVGVPGFHEFLNFFDGNLESVVYAYMDEPELFQELCELHKEREFSKLDILLDRGIDTILTGGSGSVTLQSPEIWSKLSFPAIREITMRCRQAGVVSGIHPCGKEAFLIQKCAEETDLDYVNPLELPPMGDCTLLSIRKRIGEKLCLMGNLHTTDTMLLGNEQIVRKESLQAILDGGVNGNFILSTGDQLGRDTPDQNLFAMVTAAKEFGKYPLNIERIQNEIHRLQIH